MLKWKWALILGVTVISAVAIFWPGKGIRLGLDLKGGIHLVIRVETDDAIRAELDESVNRLRLRLEERSIPYASVDRLLDTKNSTYRVVVKGVKEEDQDRARKVLEAALRDYQRDASGTDLIASLPPARVAEIRDVTVEQALNTIEERINATGVTEPVIQRQGLRGDRILLQLPGVEDPEHVKRLIGRVAFLELKLVESGPFSSREEAIRRAAATRGGDGSTLPPGLELVEGNDEEGRSVYHVVDRVPVITGRDLARAQAARDELGQPSVAFTLNAEGARKFGDVTGKNVGKQLAIILDGRVKSAPVIRSRISDRGQIEGGFTAQEARDLSLVLRAGALPATIQYLEERTVGPFLGRDSIRRGTISGVVGLIGIAICMVIYYRRSGVNAVIALILNGWLLFGALALLRATLTLPGIAGAILTLGMAVDANVLIFEAVREGLRRGVAPRRALEEGFSVAFTTIVDTHLTTMLAAAALWLLGSGPVRGFGVTLLIGLMISMFTAYFVSQTLFQTTVLRRDWKPGETLSI